MERRLRIWLGVAAAFLLLSLTLAGCGTAPQDVITAPVSAPVVSIPPAAPEAVAPPAPDKPGVEGIQVHGHWTIEVTNPDGSAAGKYEFENSLQEVGASFLARVLARTASPDYWYIYLEAVPETNSPWFDDVGGDSHPELPLAGVIRESNDPGWDGSFNFENLTVTGPDPEMSYQGGHLLVLSGNATAQRNGEINRVSSKFQYQLTGVGEFTSKDLSSTVILSAGQQINVTVVISFS